MGKVAMDMARRRMVAAAEVPRLVLKSIIRSTRLPMSVRQAAVQQLAGMDRNTSHTRIRNRCVETGRARAVYNDFRVNRMIFRKWALNGELPGICKFR